MIDRIAELKLHPQADAIESDLDTVETRLLEQAKGQADGDNYQAALGILGTANTALDTAKGRADQCATYLDERFKITGRLNQCSRHKQSAAIAIELQQANAKLVDAASKANVAMRDYAGAIVDLNSTSHLINSAQSIAGRCQAFVDDRPAAADLVNALTNHKEANTIQGTVDTVTRKLADADGLAAVGVRKYDEAIALLVEIKNAGVDAVKLADKAQWEKGEAKLTTDVQSALGLRGADRTRLEGQWAVATERAGAADYAGAMKIVPSLIKLIDEAKQASAGGVVQEGAPKSPGPGIEKGTSALTDDAAITTALEKARSLLAVQLKAAVDAAVKFGPNPPAAWQVETDRIAASLTLGREAGLPALQQAVTKAEQDLVKQTKAVTDLTQAKQTWIATWALYEQQRDSLASHVSAATEPVLGKLNAIKTAAGLAKTKSTTNDFAGATTDLQVQLDKFDELFKLADAAARYRAVRDKRSEMIGTLPPSGSNPQGQFRIYPGHQSFAAGQHQEFAGQVRRSDGAARPNPRSRQ